jgi:hypothetical protein
LRARRILVKLALVTAFGCAAAAVAPAGGDVSLRPPQLVRLSDAGPQFLSYDGRLDLRDDHRDWPVSLVFTGNATVTKVKRALRKAGLRRYGNVEYLAYRLDGVTLRFDGDRGLKSACDANGSDIHVRLYAPTAAGRFTDPELGSVVVGTTHVDHADGCSSPPKLYGFSEDAEQRVAALMARQGWRVEPGGLTLGNPEPYRRDVEDPAHIWWSDGRATLITVP